MYQKINLIKRLKKNIHRAVSMCNGFVLRNLQVTHSIVTSEYATLHSVGKKIVEKQLSMSDGSTLYLVIVAVAKEDVST